jgi:hypothetical protein
MRKKGRGKKGHEKIKRKGKERDEDERYREMCEENQSS